MNTGVIFNEIVRKSQVPMVITDNQNVPINWNNISYKFWSKGKSKIPQVPFFYLAKTEQEFLLKLVDVRSGDTHLLRACWKDG